MGKKKAWKVFNLGLSVVASGAFLYILSTGVPSDGIPPLGSVLDPATGAWTMAKDASLPKNEKLSIPGLEHPVTVSWDTTGTPVIQAASDHDLFLATGYIHAKYRLFQMDLMRRQGEGLLSQVVGREALSSDEFERTLGLTQTAEEEWNQMAPTDPAREALTAYTSGVNTAIQAMDASHDLPSMFKLLNYTPTAWTPIDSLVVQGDMTQTLDFTTTPLDYALLVHSLGYQRTMDWFPVLPKDQQHPYDPGPYKMNGVAPIESQATVSNAEAKEISSLVDRIHALPASLLHHGSNSNNWAVDGTKTASGQAMLAGDPHLNQTLPSIWFQIGGNSPSYHFSGVSIPGLPTILIGRNQNIAWSLTNVQNQATYFYTEKVDAKDPDSYFWNGQWRKMKIMTESIPVKGLAPVKQVIKSTVHGPLLTQNGMTVAVDWMGALPSPDMDAILNVLHASNFTQFKNALKTWHAPSQNFVYADAKGNIGLISAGYYPLIQHGDPWLPLSGTGESDIVGTIPFEDVPQVYNPKSHFVFSANQREVGNDYPYYIGTTLDFFADGYRADEIEEYLSTHSNMTAANFAELQNSTKDYLAGEIVPKLITSLAGANLSPEEQQAVQLLKSWNDNMDANSAAASIWWSFWEDYIQATFAPWWTTDKVPVGTDENLTLDDRQVSLDQDLEAWTLHDMKSDAYTLPDGTKRTANQVMTQAFQTAVTNLSKSLGSDPSTWAWGKLHTRTFPSLAQIPSLGYGPRSSGGDPWTVDAADGGMDSQAGPSWRMIIDFGGTDIGVYPGGQSEDPASPWYENEIDSWWNGKYIPMPNVPSSSAKMPVLATWTFEPKGDTGE